jgi:hypothetical protein
VPLQMFPSLFHTPGARRLCPPFFLCFRFYGVNTNLSSRVSPGILFCLAKSFHYIVVTFHNPSLARRQKFTILRLVIGEVGNIKGSVPMGGFSPVLHALCKNSHKDTKSLRTNYMHKNPLCLSVFVAKNYKE